MGVCTRNMSSYEYINKIILLHQVGITHYFRRKMHGQTTLKSKTLSQKTNPSTFNLALLYTVNANYLQAGNILTHLVYSSSQNNSVLVSRKSYITRKSEYSDIKGRKYN